jgi:hypothetical protein
VQLRATVRRLLATGSVARQADNIGGLLAYYVDESSGLSYIRQGLRIDTDIYLTDGIRRVSE